MIAWVDLASPMHRMHNIDLQRGDVVTVQPHPWPWTRNEVTDRRFRILIVPRAPALLMDMTEDWRTAYGHMLARSRGFDLESMPTLTAMLQTNQVVELDADDARRLLASKRAKMTPFTVA